MVQPLFRFLTWNVGHQARPKALPIGAAIGLTALDPDVLVLTEYVYDDSHEEFLSRLAAAGLRHWLVSDRVPRQNQVLVASRFDLKPGAIRCTVGLSDATAPNWLHVRLADTVDVIGFRRPMFKNVPRGVTRYWEWLSGAIGPLIGGATVLLGDFNAGAGATPIRQLVSKGWQLVSPPSGWSYDSGGVRSAIDHGLASPMLALAEDPEYIAQIQEFNFTVSPTGYSDHAVLRFELSHRASHRAWK